MSLAEWYGKREILVTGVTSELGRLLLEKLLRTLPSVTIHAIVRSRDALTREDRVKRIFASPGFERLRQHEPNAIERVRILEGNLLYDNLGLSRDEIVKLKNIDVLFHAGGPTDNVYDFSRTLPQLRAVAVATDILREKNLSEISLGADTNASGVPLVMLRLPFIGPSYKEPMPGFVELLRGPTALMIGAGFALGRTDLPAEVVPVDLAVNALITAAWERGTRDKKEKPSIYNMPNLGCTWAKLIEMGNLAQKNFPYPTFGIRGMTSVALLHWMIVFFLEWLPSAFCDVILTICGAKPRCVTEYEKVRKALQSVEAVTSKPLAAERSAIYRLEKRLTSTDRETYPIICDIDIESYVLCAAASARKNCISEGNAKIIGNFKKFFIALPVVILLYILYEFSKH